MGAVTGTDIGKVYMLIAAGRRAPVVVCADERRAVAECKRVNECIRNKDSGIQDDVYRVEPVAVVT